MLHPSSIKLVDRLYDMTLKGRVEWREGETSEVLVFDVSGYRVLLETSQKSIVLCDVLGKELHRADQAFLANTQCADGGTYLDRVSVLSDMAQGIARQADIAFDKIIEALTSEEAVEPSLEQDVSPPDASETFVSPESVLEVASVPQSVEAAASDKTEAESDAEIDPIQAENQPIESIPASSEPEAFDAPSLVEVPSALRPDASVTISYFDYESLEHKVQSAGLIPAQSKNAPEQAEADQTKTDQAEADQAEADQAEAEKHISAAADPSIDINQNDASNVITRLPDFPNLPDTPGAEFSETISVNGRRKRRINPWF